METVMKRPQESPRACISRLEQLLKSGHADAAIRGAKDILKKDPKQIGALELLAKAQWQAGKFAALRGTIDRLIHLNPYEPGYFELRGAACRALGRLGESIRSFARASESSESSRAAIEELRSFQVGIISDLVSCDATFRARYSQNPHFACQSVGLDLLPEDSSSEGWITVPSLMYAAVVRPS